MKYSILLFFALVISFTSFSQDGVKKFDENKLSKKELKSCKKFREKIGKDRLALFMEVIHIFPAPKFNIVDRNTMMMQEQSITVQMTYEQLYQLIGEPDLIKSGGLMQYNLDDKNCSAYFGKTSNSDIYFVSFANCPD